MATSIIDIDAFHNVPCATDPFPYLIVPHFIRSEKLSEVEAAYPAIGKPGSFPPASLKIEGVFERLLQELEGAEFKRAIELKFGIDLSLRPTMITVRGQTDNTDGRIHTDSTSKIVTVLIYFNGKWEKPGGRLRLLRSANDLNDVAAEVPPDEGTLVAFLNQPNAWHGHEPFDGPRRAIQLNWVRDRNVVRKEEVRHRISAFFKSLFGRGTKSDQRVPATPSV